MITLDSLNGFFCFVLFCGNETFNSIQVFHIAHSFLLKVNSVEKKNYKKHFSFGTGKPMSCSHHFNTRGGEVFFHVFQLWLIVIHITWYMLKLCNQRFVMNTIENVISD